MLVCLLCASAGSQVWRAGWELLARKAVWIRTWLWAPSWDQSQTYLHFADWSVGRLFKTRHELRCLLAPRRGKGELPPSAELPVGPLRTLKLTLRLLEPLGVYFSKVLASFFSVLHCSYLIVHSELRNVFQTPFFISQREHYIFLQGVDWSHWCHIILHKECT